MLKIEFPEEVLISEGAKWVMKMPVVYGVKGFITDKDAVTGEEKVIFTIELTDEE